MNVVEDNGESLEAISDGLASVFEQSMSLFFEKNRLI